MLKRIVLIICLLVACAHAVTFGQDFPTIHYTVDDGLPSNTVYSVYRDDRGFLWVATDKGVARYNGIRFEKFTTSDGIPDNEVFFFREDKQGRLWLATYNGELCYYQDSRFHTAANTPFLKLPFKNTFINKITIEADSSITIMFDNQEKFINIVKDHIDIIDRSVSSGLAGFISMYKMPGGLFKFFYIDSFKVADKNHRIVSRGAMRHNFSQHLEPRNFVYSIAQDQKYVVTGNDIFTTDMKRIKVIDDLNKSGLQANPVYFDKDGKFFMGTDNGLFIDDSIHILPDFKVTSVTQDIESNYWVSTFYNGVYVVNNNYVNFHLYNAAYAGSIRYAYADNDQLFYTNSDNNLYSLSGGLQHLLFNYVGFSAGKPEYAINHGFLVTHNTDDDTYDYYNYYKNYILHIRDILHGRIVQSVDKPFNDIESVKSIIDGKDKMYIRTINKVYAQDLSDFLHPELMGGRNAREVAVTDRIFGFAKDARKSIWFCTVNGVYKITDTAFSKQPQFKDVTFKKCEFIGDLLVGYTANNRLIVCSQVDGQVKIDTVFGQDCIWDKFYKIDESHLLISTNDVYRLFTLNPPELSPRYTVTGIENPILPLGAEFFCSDGRSCFFFNKGNITKMGVYNLMQRTKPPSLFFDLITYGKYRYVMHDYLKVPYQGKQNISIRFSTLSFTGKSVFYKYSVSGNDDDNWLELTGDHIDLIAPKYGRYNIKIKAKSVSSAYCTPVEFTLEIAPPYWATWWFILICIIVGVSIIVLYVRYRILVAFRKTRAENETKIRFLKSEYKALNALMNPHFIFNTLNNVQGLVNRNDKLAANEYLRIFADLIRQNMHNVSKELIPLQKEIDLVANYLALEKLRFKEMLNYSINVDDEVDTTEIMVPPLFIQPLVENSIKHGIFPKQSENSRIDVNIYEQKDVLYIEVRDNGVGLAHSRKKADSKHESFGLNNIQVRTEQLSMILGKQINFSLTEVKDDAGNWTVASVTMAL
jgi:hypothetical protein